mmetsp:Transcript_4171/g.5985  ORF Transcript_4171/g.5985 Transcript_4171/m.5985 type:complete len:223 (-) Transcript_4171:673-1341(-)
MGYNPFGAKGRNKVRVSDECSRSIKVTKPPISSASTISSSLSPPVDSFHHPSFSGSILSFSLSHSFSSCNHLSCITSSLPWWLSCCCSSKASIPSTITTLSFLFFRTRRTRLPRPITATYPKADTTSRTSLFRVRYIVVDFSTVASQKDGSHGSMWDPSLSKIPEGNSLFFHFTSFFDIVSSTVAYGLLRGKSDCWTFSNTILPSSNVASPSSILSLIGVRK